MASGESATPRSDHKPRGLASFLRSQMRNIAPFLTLIILLVFFSVASRSFASFDNAGAVGAELKGGERWLGGGFNQSRSRSSTESPHDHRGRERA